MFGGGEEYCIAAAPPGGGVVACFCCCARTRYCLYPNRPNTDTYTHTTFLSLSLSLSVLVPQVSSNQGVMVLNHEGVRRVVWEKYVQSSQTKLTYHRILANYFQLQKTSHRKMEEVN